MGQTKGHFDDLVVLIKKISQAPFFSTLMRTLVNLRLALTCLMSPCQVEIVWYKLDLSLILLKIPKPTFVSTNTIHAATIANWGTF